MAAVVLGCRKALVITGWVISVNLHKGTITLLSPCRGSVPGIVGSFSLDGRKS